jgi:heat shock protein HtpX
MKSSAFNKNNLKTVTLLASLTGALVLVGSLIGGRSGASVGLVLGLLMVGGSYWFSDRIAVRAAGARPMEPAEFAWLQHDLAGMAERGGMPVPRLYLSPSPQPNAFATGRNERKALVCVTEGLIEALDRRELRGVVAHELAHIKNKDILIGSIAAAIATGLTFVVQMAMWSGLFGGDDEDRPNPVLLMLMMLVAPLAASLIQMALSRSREFEADRVGAEIAGDPGALASALSKIEVLSQRVPMRISPSQASAWIVNPLSGRKVQFANLFLTHPPTADRVDRLMRAS